MAKDTADNLGVTQFSRQRELNALRHAILSRHTDGTLASFQQAIDDYTTKLLPEELKVFQGKIAFEALRRIVLKTPVDTGRARGNWQTTVGSAPAGEQRSETPIEDGAAVLKQIEAFCIVYVSNNVPYIIYLEDGSSKQAPHGMLRITLSELEAMFR